MLSVQIGERDTMRTDALDDALDRMRGTWTEVEGGGDPNHGPMVVEALVTLGRGDLAPAWASRYRKHLTALPPVRSPITAARWRDALGAEGRLADWFVFFQRLIAEASWSDVLKEWLPRLVPAIITAGRHGLIRTAHAVRALGERATPLRVEELGMGLAYWASHYRELGPQPQLRGALPLADALARVPRILRGKDRPGMPRKFIYEVRDRPELLAAMADLSEQQSIEEAIGTLSETGARLYLANRSQFPLIFVHSVTAPAAFRTLLPFMSAVTKAEAFAHFWQAEAATIAAYGEDNDDVATALQDERPSWSEVIDRSIENDDPHSIKFVEACFRESKIRPSPVFLAAASDWSHRLRVSSSWTWDQRRATGIVM